jgi:hypothetical protein
VVGVMPGLREQVVERLQLSGHLHGHFDLCVPSETR